jgi:LysM repeat protein
VQWNHFQDGELQYMEANGLVQQRIMDAVDEANASGIGARFVRVFSGDTLEKLAAQYQVPIEHLTAHNPGRPDGVFDQDSVACIQWKYRVPQDQNLAQIAESVHSDADTLRRLNGLEPQAEVKAGTELTIPGQFQYQSHGTTGYLQVAMFSHDRQPDLPFRPETAKINRSQVEKDQTLADIAQKHQVTEEFLRTMNGLDEDDVLEAGTPLLIDFTVEMREEGSLERLMQMYSITRERLDKANGWEAPEDVDLAKPVHVPIGEQLRAQVRIRPPQAELEQPTTDAPAFEIQLGQTEDS